MAKYFVDVFMSTLVRVEVEASDETEARALAVEEADPYMALDDEWEYNVENVEINENEDDEEDEW